MTLEFSDESSFASTTARPLRDLYMPVPVVIQTEQAEIEGFVYVERSSREERKLSELLNDPRRRFIAVTEARVVQRFQASSPLHYPFLQVRIDSIVLMHPVLRQYFETHQYQENPEQQSRFAKLREKLQHLQGQVAPSSED
jgi:hypothetical protein